MNIFQRTLAALFPRSFGKMRRGYQGAVVTRLNSDWLSSQLSPDAEVRNSLRKLRDRSRELIRNNPLKPLINKTLSGLYSPGSTIKPIVALSALENKVSCVAFNWAVCSSEMNIKIL